MSEPFSQVVVEVSPGERFGVETRVSYEGEIAQVELVYTNPKDPTHEFTLRKQLNEREEEQRRRDQPLEIVDRVPEDQAPGAYFCSRMVVRTPGGEELTAADVPHDNLGVRVTEPDQPYVSGWRVFTPQYSVGHNG